MNFIFQNFHVISILSFSNFVYSTIVYIQWGLVRIKWQNLLGALFPPINCYRKQTVRNFVKVYPFKHSWSIYRCQKCDKLDCNELLFIDIIDTRKNNSNTQRGTSSSWNYSYIFRRFLKSRCINYEFWLTFQKPVENPIWGWAISVTKWKGKIWTPSQ